MAVFGRSGPYAFQRAEWFYRELFCPRFGLQVRTTSLNAYRRLAGGRQMIAPRRLASEFHARCVKLTRTSASFLPSETLDADMRLGFPGVCRPMSGQDLVSNCAWNRIHAKDISPPHSAHVVSNRRESFGRVRRDCGRSVVAMENQFLLKSDLPSESPTA